MIGEEKTVGVGKIEEAADAVVDVGLDGDQAGGEVGVLTLPACKGLKRSGIGSQSSGRRSRG